jgi:hypothetical protein
MFTDTSLESIANIYKWDFTSLNASLKALPATAQAYLVGLLLRPFVILACAWQTVGYIAR